MSDGWVDRRAFLAQAGAAGLAIATGANRAALAQAAARITGPPIRGQVIRPGTDGFLQAAHIYNQRFDDVLPALIARPVNAAAVRTAVTWGVAHRVPLRARSGGHSYAGYSTLSGGLMLDLRNLRSVSVDTRHRVVTVGAGAQVVDVYAALAQHGLTIPAGTCPSVGIAGHALGGGMGLAGRQFGLTADNILSAQIVTADGRLLTASATSNPDLYWALRGGGGGNFGVVTSIRFRAHPVPSTVSSFFVSWPWARAADALAAWQAWAPHARSQLTSVFHLSGANGTTSVNVTGQYLGLAADLGYLLTPLAAVAGARVRTANHSYLDAQLVFAGCSTISMPACHTEGTQPGGMLDRASFRAKSDYVAKPLPAAARQILIQEASARAQVAGAGAILFDCYGGAVNRVAPAATAFVHRDVLFCIQYFSRGSGTSWLDSVFGRMRPFVTGGSYVNYTDPGLNNWQTAYYGSNYRRLLKIRRKYDPHHYFNFPQAIGR